jgi:hypothetical protein
MTSKAVFSLWDTVLREDYGISQLLADSRQSCKRRHRCPIDRVGDAHVFIQDRQYRDHVFLPVRNGSEQMQRRVD